MIWTFMVVSSIAFGLLGALSVWVVVLSLALKVSLLLFFIAALFLMWHLFYRK